MSTVTLLKTKPIYAKNLEEKVENLRFLDREIKKLMDEYTPLKKEIIKEMSDRKLLRVVNSFGHEIATYKPKKSPDGFDKERFEADFPNVYEQYKIIKLSTYEFRLTK